MKVTLEKQLQILHDCGVRLASGITIRLQQARAIDSV